MLNRLYGWYGKRVVRGALGALILLVVVGLVLRGGSLDTTTNDEVAKKPIVTLRTVASLQSESNFSVVGTVRAVSEATLQAEAGGRVTAVNVRTGDTVALGTILATIENSSERAALLQAEGAYESALAASRGSGVGLDEARVGARNTYRSAFTSVEGVIRNLVDEFFSNTDSAIIGFKLDGGGQTEVINATRREIETMLTEWSSEIARGGGGGVGTEAVMLENAEDRVTLVNDFVTKLAFIVSEEDPNAQFTEDDLALYATRLAGARTSLEGMLSTISGARQALEQAEVAGGTGAPSQSDALLKSALGALRSAQANYEKTLVRTPISGVVNALYLTEGTYASLGEPAAIVANNGSLEVSAALGESDLETIAIGDTVYINETITGTITNIAPAVDPLTGKAEVKVSVDDADTLKNGSTVTVTFKRGQEDTSRSDIMVLPLSALKLLPSGPIAFGIDDRATLIAYPVTLGDIMGDTVEITGGLTPESIIVSDARGLRAGDVVEIAE